MCPITRKLGLVKILPISCPVTRVYLLGHARLNNKPCVPSPLGGDTWVNTYTDKDFHFSVASEDRGAFEKNNTAKCTTGCEIFARNRCTQTTIAWAFGIFVLCPGTRARVLHNKPELTSSHVYMWR